MFQHVFAVSLPRSLSEGVSLSLPTPTLSLLRDTMHQLRSRRECSGFMVWGKTRCASRHAAGTSRLRGPSEGRAQGNPRRWRR